MGYNIGNIDLRTLPSGTSFHVVNGDWNGTIIEIDGEKYVKNSCTTFKLTDSYAVSNEIVINSR